MAGGPEVNIDAVATRIRRDEKEAIEELPSYFGKTIADKLRVFIRFGLERPELVAQWLEDTDGKPV